ncbi:MAG: alpha-galactosidase [Verrucomicrobiae bacterium]|nr:alpha-galactosidase [Verrucomicrobiae bacterium]
MVRLWLLVLAGGWAMPGLIGAPDWLLDPSPYTARVTPNADGRELVMENGLLRRVIRIHPNAATVALDHLGSGESLLRGVKPEAVVELEGRQFEVGGLKGQPNYAFLRPEWIPELQADTNAFQFTGYSVGRPEERLSWRRVRHHAPGVKWPPEGVSLRLDFAAPESAAGTSAAGVRISVHFELYDGVPAYSKWLTLTQTGAEPVRLDRFSSEVLAFVERTSEVDELSEGAIPPNVHVETDMSFGGMMASGANRRSYRWLPDPDFHTQVNYEKRTPCLLEVGPDLGPAQTLQPGVPWESYRTWVLPMDATDRERCGLSVRRLYRIIAPWTTENPLMMHLVSSDGATVTNAIEQCAAVGFEMLILSFGSGFNMENESPRTLEQARAFASHARRRGVEIGSYSLLASRSIGADQDVVMPPGRTPAFGNAPCLQSAWGINYFRRLYTFHRESGFTLLEHDGSYPGDPCASTAHPGHRGLDDSRWNQWREIAGFYGWCRGQGIYLNVPDYYFLSGSSKVAMGYREVNWSLPRDEQVIHTRQNIYDGTWQKLPSMGWMFVPLTEYHGGGPAATIEPLETHLDHYARMLDSNLALGVQACYRGPRLFDTERTRDLVASKVAWFKANRDLLESDLIHGRRADARDLDWMLHVNPRLPQKGLLAVFNPTAQPIARTLRVSLYYTGLTGEATVRDADGRGIRLPIAPDGSVELPVLVPPQGMSTHWLE